jgi:hypothetical protein
VLVPGDAEAGSRARLGDTFDVPEPVYRWLLDTAASVGSGDPVVPKGG